MGRNLMGTNLNGWYLILADETPIAASAGPREYAETVAEMLRRADPLRFEGAALIVVPTDLTVES